MQDGRESSAKQIVSKVWGWARRNPLFSIPGALAGIELVADQFGNYQLLDSAMTWLLGPDWFSVVLDSPWFDVAMLTIAVFCFYRMGQAGLRQDRQIAEEMEQRAVEREAARTTALQPVANLIENSAEAVRLSSLKHSLAQIGERLSVYEDRVADAQVGKAKIAETIERPYSDLDMALRAIETQLGIDSPKIAFPKAVYEKDGQTVDPANNEAYYKDVCDHLGRIKRRATAIGDKVARIHDEIAQRNANLLGVRI